ncbi:uncharacterized protein SPAPADRAFT_59207 [Spathaspora passalidarum NRRL Y-27907]|uniref:CREG-like beta-barrel domain-containing protein n=1 Tax=Spathaspora passalidarum (strain NRRL Y-27907 / 11-Y1) TaxID=619300 RepID=G3AJ89_SPAPN|nr:uncharacterized protein SPAPADRAFT_59207 [Spathaspora passalidarum NRRL Y-27907]EGW33846.1 hypothetical protein SPAPADRAFT_59207 [Spathaspora passalidarum NRRL Y-27907]
MRLSSLLSLSVLSIGTLGAPLADEQVILKDIPTVDEGARVARTLVNRESLTNINTIKTIKQLDGSVRHLPVSSMEYYADCDSDGDPYWLAIDVGGTNQNIIRGSDYSFTIRVGDHPNTEKVDESYPGSIPASPAGSPRVQLTGRLQKITFTNPFDPKKVALERCFLAKHPDAAVWLPNNIVTPHKSHWTKLVVDGVYMVGGFGDRAYIGEINAELYHSAEIIEENN